MRGHVKWESSGGNGGEGSTVHVALPGAATKQARARRLRRQAT